MRIPSTISGNSYPCGAALDPGKLTCRKCRARARWLRRKYRFRNPTC